MTNGQWAEEISKFLVPKLKNFKMEATQVITAYYKVAEISRTRGRGATELFEQLVNIKERDLSVEQKNQLFDEAVENARSLAVFAWAQAKQQYDDAEAYVTEDPRLPQSLKHLERPKDDILQVGRLNKLLQHWQAVTPHPWTISIIESGYRIQFAR
ncbi:hypothetical protein G6F37_007616 [Rhizopus arrhizus]|nr:hypothetical protein G6F38_007730 [Rhizopus arrhizus]KAG1156423.1 hypothetical protein G6F37_007616 [Rhizopus arrhizus]